MKIAEIVYSSKSEGPGKRFVIWLQGCSIGCKNCINQEMLSFDGGSIISIDQIFKQILDSKRDNDITGVTFLGGEPLDQKNEVLRLLKKIKGNGLNSILFTGYGYKKLLNQMNPVIDEIFDNLDVLIEGPYIDEEYTEKLYLRGSTNQKIIFLSEKINKKEFKKKNSFDIIAGNGKVRLTGFPFKKIIEVINFDKK